MQSVFRAHLTAFLFLVPFVTMLTIHQMLGLSNNLMIGPTPGEPDSQIYNLFMVTAFWGGVFGFIWHVLSTADRSRRLIVLVKLLALVSLWAILLLWKQ